MEAGAGAEATQANGNLRLAAAITAALPALGFALLLVAPDLDVEWHHDPSHFWLVMIAAATTAVLAYATGDAAERRGDARLYWISLSFLAAGGFLALHALATPEVFLEASNLGFQIATPVGLTIASAFAAASALPIAERLDQPTMRRVRAGLLALMALWAIATIAGVAPLDRVTAVERASGPITVLAVAGAALFGFAAFRYAGVARARRALLPLAVATGFILLAEAILATAFARNWHASWWEWHLLILVGFAIVAWAARREWREERFSSLYGDRTVRGERELSILFADLAGFTSFSEARDPGEVREMLNAYFEVAIPPVVREHDGVVNQLSGDQLMATFLERPGTDDHPLRAARAALAIRDRTGALADAHPQWPRFRIGVNTGVAVVGVVGAGGARSYTVIGDVVNTGSRLESEAPVGEIVVAAATLERLGDATVRRLGALRVKGKREPLEAYVLTALPGEASSG